MKEWLQSPLFSDSSNSYPLEFNVPKNIYKYIYTFFHDAIYKHVFLSAENEAILWYPTSIIIF